MLERFLTYFTAYNTFDNLISDNLRFYSGIRASAAKLTMLSFFFYPVAVSYYLYLVLVNKIGSASGLNFQYVYNILAS